jgi:hypothetical protein
MEAMVSEILSSLQQAKRDEKNENAPSVALLPSWNRDEETKGQVALDWPFVLTGSLESNTKPDRMIVSLMVPLPVSRKAAELAELWLPLMTSLPANDEGIDDLGLNDPLAAEVSPNFSRSPIAASERVKDPKDAGRENQSHRTAHSGWIRWFESLGGFLLMVGGPTALWGSSIQRLCKTAPQSTRAGKDPDRPPSSAG